MFEMCSALTDLEGSLGRGRIRSGLAAWQGAEAIPKPQVMVGGGQAHK